MCGYVFTTFSSISHPESRVNQLLVVNDDLGEWGKIQVYNEFI